jgi:hypothetical protein
MVVCPRLLLVVLALAAPAPAWAAAPPWLGGLFPAAHRPAHHAPAPKNPAKHANPKPAAEPASTPAEAVPPVPLPRPRPAPAAPAAEPAPAPAAEPAPPVSTPTPATPPADDSGKAAAAEKPPRIYQTACPAVLAGLVVAKALPPISENECQEASPLSVTAIGVNGRTIPLSAPATFNCAMATDLPAWVADVDNYIFATLKTRIASVTVGESYVCRPRNTPDHDPSLSEHGRADALDFVGFKLEDGRSLAVGSDFRSTDPATARLMQFAHDDACTRFTTVLGPDANALHSDHFHLDLGCHGKTCTFRLCE